MFLIAAAFVAGIVDSIAGGGGLITVPGLFTMMPTAAPALLLGTDKVSSVFGHVSAIRHYALRIALPWRTIGLAALAALSGALLGARVVSLVPAAVMRPGVIVLLAAMLAYTLLRPDFGTFEDPTPAGRGRQMAGIVAAFVIGL